MKGVLVEQNRTPSKVSHLETIRQVLVSKVFNCLLQGDDVPRLRNVPFDGFFFPASESWVPIVDTEPLLFGQAIGHIGFLSSASRKAGLAPSTLTRWRFKIVARSACTQEPSHMDVMSCSKPDKISRQGTAKIFVWETCQIGLDDNIANMDF